MSIHTEHRATAPQNLRLAVLTVSDTRTEATDHGGALVIELLTAAGHQLVERRIVADEPAAMRSVLAQWTADDAVDAILLTGGTGIAPRDQTFETVTSLLTKSLPGYGELFRMLSYESVGAAAMLSRATGGMIGQTVVLTMPGSPAGVRLAMEKLILPELGHIVSQARRM